MNKAYKIENQLDIETRHSLETVFKNVFKNKTTYDPTMYFLDEKKKKRKKKPLSYLTFVVFFPHHSFVRKRNFKQSSS